MGSGWSQGARDGISTGMNYWNPYFDQSNQQAMDFWLASDNQSSADIQLYLDSSYHGTGMGMETINPTGASFVQINVNPDFLNSGSSQFWYHAMAHELGHVMGLAHPNSNCNGTSIMDGSISLSGPFITDSVSDRCVDYVKEESTYPEPPPYDPWCNMTCMTGCVDNTCYDPGGISPILLDLDDNGFHLDGAEHPVLFDMRADGHPTSMTWTKAGAGDAFLCLDRNHNGVIDSGAELFGNYTPLHSGERAPNGYEALKEYDAPANGGNANRYLDEDDAVWNELRLWTDVNHDGVSEPGEMVTLGAAGVQSILLQYRRDNRTDDEGNVFRFRSRAQFRNTHNTHSHSSMTYDVFFVEMTR